MSIRLHPVQHRYWIFDLDGTLTVAAHDFEGIRAELGLPAREPILESLAALPSAQAAPLRAQLDRIELGIAERAVAEVGAALLLTELQRCDCSVGVLTRNSRENARLTLAAAGLSDFFHDDDLLGRESCAPKPAPDGILQLLHRWSASAAQAVMVGDYLFDLLAGRAAGVTTVHVHADPQSGWPEHTDLRVNGLDGLLARLRA